MPKHLLKRFTPHPHSLRDRWYVRLFGSWLAHPALWSLQRRSVTGAFGAGLAICFVPLPIHLPLAVLVAAVWKLNVSTIVGTVFLVNPLTVVPIYLLAYRVGTALMGYQPTGFAFEPSWDWLQHGLGPSWKPFLLGCLTCSLVFGLVGRLTFEYAWRRSVRNKYRTRHSSSTL